VAGLSTVAGALEHQATLQGAVVFWGVGAMRDDWDFPGLFFFNFLDVYIPSGYLT
jgi:hypothetical protein